MYTLQRTGNYYVLVLQFFSAVSKKRNLLFLKVETFENRDFRYFAKYECYIKTLKMNDIKCFKNYKELKEMLRNGEKGNACYFSSKLNISTRTFFRLIKYLDEIEGIKARYNKAEDVYYLECL